ncbi:MAG: right-handed parallel beta-helix repeat-containing protein [Phycisphaerales bacterium]|nr:MAG: right-handed parallel beta-helix repeat-containing protein [Phycisphaerales bacterium]
MYALTRLELTLLVAAAVAGTLAAPPASASTIFVNIATDPGGDGSSWDLAFDHLQDALEAANPGDEIWVAAGTYVPIALTDPCLGCTATFVLPSGVAVYGGFDGTEQDLDERDPQANVTVLSGLLEESPPSACCFVHDDPGCDCAACADAVCEYAQYCCEDQWDEVCVALAGFLCEDTCPPTASNACHVVWAVDADANTRLDGFTIQDAVTDGDSPPELQFGGAMIVMDGDPIIANCAFINNHTDFCGGGLYVDSGDPEIFGCTFVGNTALENGGGLYLPPGDHSLVDCSFVENTADQSGGGLYVQDSAASFQGCTFIGNTSMDDGGGITASECTISLADSTFADNSRGISSLQGSVEASHCSFINNGKGIAGLQSNVEVSHCSFTDNRGAILNLQSAFVVKDCEFIDNESEAGGAIYNEGGSGSVTDCLFVVPDAEWGDGGAIHNAQCDPLIARCGFFGDYPDIYYEGAWKGGGIYNDQSSPTIVDCLFSGLRAIKYGGAIFSWQDSNPLIERCIFVGNCAWTGYGEGSGGAIYNDYATVATITGCTFVGNVAGHVDSQDFNNVGYGGAVYSASDELTLTNCAFRDNLATGAGGAATLAYSDSPITGCEFEGNQARFSGGGALYLWYPANGYVVADCTFRHNEGYWGGAVAMVGAYDSVVKRCRFFDNHATAYGGGAVACWEQWEFENRPVFVNSLFSGNHADDGNGGAIAVWWDSHATLINCTLDSNQAAKFGGGVFVGKPNYDPAPKATASATVLNSILWGNSDVGGAGERAQVFVQSYYDLFWADLDYSCVDGWTGIMGGTGNIGDDPLFIDPLGPDGQPGTEDDNLRLGAGSPCMDAADNTAVPDDVLTDLAGNPRFVDDPDTEDTGFGDPPIVDMGAYEFQADDCRADCAPPGGDGVVKIDDLFAVLGAWGQNGGECDINGDGTVNAEDLLAVLAAWGSCP